MSFRSIALFFIASLISMSMNAQTYAPKSVLAEGEWYKIAINESGIYKLDRNFLQSLGLNPSGLNPQHIKIYGNGGGMLPQANHIKRYDDLVENAIWVEGEEDESFDQEDYILFYGEGPHQWLYDKDEQAFRHQYHLYSDTNFYYLSIGQTPGKRIVNHQDLGAADINISQARGLAFHEVELDNPLDGSGRYWLGEFFDIIDHRDFSFYIPDVQEDGIIRLKVRVAARSSNSSIFRVNVNNTLLGSISISNVSLSSEVSPHYLSKERIIEVPASAVRGDSLKINIAFDRQGAIRAEGWLDWIEVDYDRTMNIGIHQNSPFSVTSPNPANASIVFNGINAGDHLWDISNPLSPVAIPLEGTNNAIITKVDSNKTYISFSEEFLSPIATSRQRNQNLHGIPLVDYLMIVHPEFWSAAERLADFHRNHYGRTVALVSPQDIYNEFSSGKQDVTAIRDFIRMFYQQSGQLLPHFVLLFGDGSYDYKNIRNREEPNNFVPTYQSRNSWTPPESYTSDDFFGFMDENEGFWGERSGRDGDNDREINYLDIGIGRLPVTNASEASQIVDKIINYATSNTEMGNWRNRVVLVADHKPEDGNTHISQADSYTSLIGKANACIQVDKIFMDNYELIPTASRPSFPEGRRALLEALDEGSLIVNYTGHGGESAWSDASIFTNTDVRKMKNGDRLPIVVTATCEFGRFDNPSLVSGAEEMLLRREGGSIGLFTTVRLVYSGPNKTLNDNFYREVFTYQEDKGRMPTFGEIMKETKNRTFPRANINSRNFTLLGDPGLILNYPGLNAKITSINNEPLDDAVIDTLPSLSIVSVQGQIEDSEGKTIEDYQGDLEVTVFDKPSKFSTQQYGFNFYWQINKIFNGTASIDNGNFEFKFIVPIDVSYDEGQGKISLYAFNNEMDGAGCYSNFYVGGTDESIPEDNEGPAIELFLNDENWKDGGRTGKNPLLLAKVEDPSGINTVGSGIGHELIGFIDGDESNVILLNDFYVADKDSYTSGTIEYALSELEAGEHSLTLRAWDVANNPGEAITRFIVADNPQDALELLLNYPNPFNNNTRFLIGHNMSGQNLIITVDIFDLNGRKVNSLQDSFLATTNTFDGLDWDGKDNSGNPLANGVYIYQVLIQDEDSGMEVNKASRMVLIR